MERGRGRGAGVLGLLECGNVVAHSVAIKHAVVQLDVGKLGLDGVAVANLAEHVPTSLHEGERVDLTRRVHGLDAVLGDKLAAIGALGGLLDLFLLLLSLLSLLLLPSPVVLLVLSSLPQLKVGGECVDGTVAPLLLVLDPHLAPGKGLELLVEVLCVAGREPGDDVCVENKRGDVGRHGSREVRGKSCSGRKDHGRDGDLEVLGKVERNHGSRGSSQRVPDRPERVPAAGLEHLLESLEPVLAEPHRGCVEPRVHGRVVPRLGSRRHVCQNVVQVVCPPNSQDNLLPVWIVHNHKPRLVQPRRLVPLFHRLGERQPRPFRHPLIHPCLVLGIHCKRQSPIVERLIQQLSVLPPHLFRPRVHLSRLVMVLLQVRQPQEHLIRSPIHAIIRFQSCVNHGPGQSCQQQ